MSAGRMDAAASARGGPWEWIGLGLVCVALVCRACAQQEAPVPLGSEGKYTLHVYSDLVQVPTLVLNPLHAPYRGLNAADFQVQIDSGPMFRPRHVRVEGDDPITFGVLLDVSHTESNALPAALDWALSKLHDEVLSPQDFFSVYAFDCNLVRGADDVPASNTSLRGAVLQALKSPALHHDSKTGGHCTKNVHLWDAIGVAAMQMHEYPGRRVLVVVSDGEDRGSIYSWEAIRHVLTGDSVTAFGIRPSALPLELVVNGVKRNALTLVDMEDPFELLCGGSGGLVMASNQETMAPLLRRIVEMVRQRYILEFPRPSNGTTGQHRIDIATKDTRAIVRVTGASFPPTDKDKLSEPGTVQPDPDRAPVVGERRILSPN